MTAISQPYLKSILSYNAETGHFRWKIVSKIHLLGERAGSLYPNGYRHIQVDGVAHREARLAWIYMTGEDPGDYVDHENTVKDNNSWANLRLATNSQNQANRGNPVNNTSGVKGVSWNGTRQKWCAAITVNGVARNLGRYRNFADAVEARRVAAIEAWGDFAWESKDAA